MNEIYSCLLIYLLTYFSGYPTRCPTANKKAKTAAERLYSDYFVLRFGLPNKILQGESGEFENDIFKELAKLCGVKRISKTLCHPQTNGKVERMNQTIISMLQTLQNFIKVNERTTYRS